MTRLEFFGCLGHGEAGEILVGAFAVNLYAQHGGIFVAGGARMAKVAKASAIEARDQEGLFAVNLLPDLADLYLAILEHSTYAAPLLNLARTSASPQVSINLGQRIWFHWQYRHLLLVQQWGRRSTLSLNLLQCTA